MYTITSQIKNLSVNGLIPEGKVAKLAQVKDGHEAESIRLLQQCIAWVGMTLESEIKGHIANIQGTKFNEIEFFAERLPGEQ